MGQGREPPSGVDAFGCLCSLRARNAALGAVALRYNTLIRDIDRSLERLEAERIVDHRPLFVAGDQKPSHDAVRAWARGFWRAMALAPATWSADSGGSRPPIPG
jgi:hypothetical protein